MLQASSLEALIAVLSLTNTRIFLRILNEPSEPTDQQSNHQRDGVFSPTVNWLQDHLLPKLSKWAEESQSGEQKSKGSLRLVPLDKYTLLYQQMKQKYGERLVRVSSTYRVQEWIVSTESWCGFVEHREEWLRWHFEHSSNKTSIDPPSQSMTPHTLQKRACVPIKKCPLPSWCITRAQLDMYHNRLDINHDRRYLTSIILQLMSETQQMTTNAKELM